MSDDVADALGCDIIVPESSIKPSSKKSSVLKSLFGAEVQTFRGPVIIGIREISRPLTFESSYTVLQHAPEAAIATEIVPQAREKIEALKTAWAERNHQALVDMIGCSVRNDDPEGEEPKGSSKRHYWLTAVGSLHGIPTSIVNWIVCWHVGLTS